MCRFFCWVEDVISFELELWSVLKEMSVEQNAALAKLESKLSRRFNELERSVMVRNYAFALAGIVIALVVKLFVA